MTFPSDDEESGMVSVGWRGPKAKVSSGHYNALLLVLHTCYQNESKVYFEMLNTLQPQSDGFSP